MKKLLRTCIVLGCLFGLALPAHAELPITLNLGMGLWKNDGERDLKDTETPYGSVEWAFNDNWAAELFYAQDDARTENDRGRADIITWQLGMKYYGGSYVGEPWRVRPYAAFGAGEIDVDYGAADTVETTVNGGVGLRWMLGERLSLSGEARTLYSLDESRWDTPVSYTHLTLPTTPY